MPETNQGRPSVLARLRCRLATLAVGGFAVQDPTTPSPAPTSPTSAGDVMQPWSDLNWIDITALSVLLVFFVLGLFKGLFWQISRILILVLAYIGAARFGPDLGYVLHRWTASSPGPETSETAAYLAYVLVFLLVLVLLSLLALLLQGLVKKAGLTFFDRLGGGLLGVVTGGCVVLFLLGVMHMFFPQSRAAMAAGDSHSLRLSQQALDQLGKSVPDELRRVFELQPLRAPAEPGPGEGPGDGPRNGDQPPPAPNGPNGPNRPRGS